MNLKKLVELYLGGDTSVKGNIVAIVRGNPQDIEVNGTWYNVKQKCKKPYIRQIATPEDEDLYDYYGELAPDGFDYFEDYESRQ